MRRFQFDLFTLICTVVLLSAGMLFGIKVENYRLQYEIEKLEEQKKIVQVLKDHYTKTYNPIPLAGFHSSEVITLK